jgi:hypothetical protein
MVRSKKKSRRAMLSLGRRHGALPAALAFLLASFTQEKESHAITDVEVKAVIAFATQVYNAVAQGPAKAYQAEPSLATQLSRFRAGLLDDIYVLLGTELRGRVRGHLENLEQVMANPGQRSADNLQSLKSSIIDTLGILDEYVFSDTRGEGTYLIAPSYVTLAAGLTILMREYDRSFPSGAHNWMQYHQVLQNRMNTYYWGMNRSVGVQCWTSNGNPGADNYRYGTELWTNAHYQSKVWKWVQAGQQGKRSVGYPWRCRDGHTYKRLCYTVDGSCLGAPKGHSGCFKDYGEPGSPGAPPRGYTESSWALAVGDHYYADDAKVRTVWRGMEGILWVSGGNSDWPSSDTSHGLVDPWVDEPLCGASPWAYPTSP